MFTAGVAVTLIAINAVFLLWVGALQHWLIRSGMITKVLHQYITGDGGIGRVLVLNLVLFGPAVLLTTAVITGLGTVTAWRARLAELPGRFRATPVRLALPLVAGIVAAPPMSVLYADAGVWGVFDVNGFWKFVDVAASGAALAIIVVVVFHWAAEAASAWIPTVNGSLRRVCALTILIGTIGALPAVLAWFVVQNTPEITSFWYAPPSPLIEHWFGAAWGFANYGPLQYLEAIPGCGFLFALPCLYTVLGAARRTATAPRWMAGVPGLDRAVPDPAELLRASRPPARTGSPVAVGLLAGCLSMLAGLLLMSVARSTVGGAAIYAAKGAGGISLMTGWLIWLTTTFCAVGAVVVSWRARAARLSRGMLAAFIAATWATLSLPAEVYVGTCGKLAYTCASGQPRIFMTIGGFTAAAAPVEGMIGAVLLLGVLSAGRSTARTGTRLHSRTPPAVRLAALGATLLISAVGIYAFVSNYVVDQ